MLSVFDLDTDTTEFDGLVSLSPAGGEISAMAPLAVERTYTPSMISNQTMHLVASSQDDVKLEGQGRIIFAAPTDGLEAAYVGSGEVPQSTGTDGLTQLYFDQPTPFGFVPDKPMFVYYITKPGISDHTFGRLFGDGSRSVLTLLVDSKPRVVPAPEIPKMTQVPKKLSKPVPVAKVVARPVASKPARPVVQKPNLLQAIFSKTQKASSRVTPKSKPKVTLKDLIQQRRSAKSKSSGGASRLAQARNRSRRDAARRVYRFRGSRSR